MNQLHVQNEVFADQKFPSALWDSEALKVFIRDYLGPAFDEAGLDTDIWLGTLNGPEDMAWTERLRHRADDYNRFVDNILFDDGARKYIKGIAYQWAGQNCIARTHESWPEIELIQSESECGMGDNTWEYAEYIFHLINHYLRNGATAYTYWNMILDDQVICTRGWWQNSLFTITADTHEVRRNPEYYVMRFISRISSSRVRMCLALRVISIRWLLRSVIRMAPLWWWPRTLSKRSVRLNLPILAMPIAVSR